MESAAAKAQAAKVERDRELNRQKEAAQAQKALRAQVRDLLKRSQLNATEAEIAYHFVEDQRVRRIYVTDEQHKLLSQGRLAVAVWNDRSYVVTIEVSERLRSMYPGVFIHRSGGTEEVDPDDPYKDYQIPDDLIW